MNVHIKLTLLATLKTYSSQNHQHYTISKGLTIKEVFRKINLPLKLVGIILVDGKKADVQKTLNGGEHIEVLPPLAGG